jgi:hypothetical protein
MISSRCNAVDIRPLAPRRLAAFDHLLENLSVPQRIHSPPKALVFIRHQLPGFDQTVERLKHEFFTVPDVPKNLLAKNKIPAIDPNIRLMTRPYATYGSMLIEFGENLLADEPQGSNQILPLALPLALECGIIS